MASASITEVVDAMSKLDGLDDIDIKLVPVLMTKLAAMQMALTTRLLAAGTIESSPMARDQLLTANEAAVRLKCSVDYIYRHARQFPFTVRQGRMLRFSASGLDRYLKRRQGQL